MTSANATAMQTWIDQVINAGRLELVDEIASPDYRYRNPSDELRGTEAIKGLFAAYREAFPDFHVRVDDRIVSGERMAQAVTITGTHEGEFMGIPATQRRVEFRGVVMSRFEDGRIVDEWEIVDQYGFLRQLGVLPRP